MKLSAFFGHNIARGSGGDDGMNPKLNKKLSLGAESHGTIAWKGFFTQFQVLLSSIVVDNLSVDTLSSYKFQLINPSISVPQLLADSEKKYLHCQNED